MELWQSIVLGAIQGLTEFLPVSSSGHLILAREFLGLSIENTLSFDVMLHLATLLAIIFCFWGDIKKISGKLGWAIVVGTIPAVLAGFFLSDWLENTFRNPNYVAYALIAGSVVFFIADRLPKYSWSEHPEREAARTSERNEYFGNITKSKGFLIGIFQALALIPGVSRSGITISGGLFSGLSREESIKFAFLLGIPVILGAALKTILDFDSNISIFQFLNLSMLAGFTASFLSGLWAVRFLVRFLSSHSFLPFIIYRLILATIILTLS